REGSGALPLSLAFANYVASLSQQKNEQPEPDLFGNVAEVEIVLPSTPEEADAFMEKKGNSRSNAMAHPDIHYSYPVVTKKPSTPPLSTDYITEWREFIGQY